MKQFFLSRRMNYLFFNASSKIVMATLLFTCLLFFTTISYAQKAALRGSGKIVNKTFSLASFNKIEMLDLDGKAEVEAGKPFSFAVNIDDNLENLLDVHVSDGVLYVKLKGNYNNRLYIEETNIHVKISLPQIVSVFNRSNGTLTVNSIGGQKFAIKNTGNGSAYLSGNIDELDIICRDNGSVSAQNLKAKKLSVRRSGNGNVYADADKIENIENTGNGELISTGKNQQNKASSSGNQNYKGKDVNRITAIENTTGNTAELSVKYPVKGSYGIAVKSGETIKESFPVGTKIYKGNQFTVFKTPLYTVTEAAEQSFIIR